MPRKRNLDERFVNLAYAPGARLPSALFEAALSALIGWWHGSGGWLACGLAAACGILAGALDRSAALADWERLSRITMRELVQRGATACLPRSGTLRNLTPLAALIAGGVALAYLSPRGYFWQAIAIPFLYIPWLFGRDFTLTLAPPRKPLPESTPE